MTDDEVAARNESELFLAHADDMLAAARHRRKVGCDQNPPSSLTKNEKQAIQAFLERLNREIGNLTQTVALFGSKARGMSKSDSDIDILIIVEQENWLLRRTISGWAAEISLEYDVLLEPRVIGSDLWAKMAQQKFSLFENITQDRVILQT